MTRILGVATVVAFASTTTSAQQPQSKTGGVPPTGTTKTVHPAMTRPVLPAYHPATTTNPNPLLPRSGTTTISPNPSVTIISPNGTTTSSSGNSQSNSVVIHPSINTSPYYQALQQNALFERALLSSYYNPYAFSPYSSLYSPFNNPLAGFNNPLAGYNNPFVGFNNPLVPYSPFNPLMSSYGYYPPVNPVTARILQADAFAFPFQTPAIFALNPYTTPLMAKVLLADAFAFPFQMPAAYSNPVGLLGNGLVVTPPIGYQQPGPMIAAAPNLAFNPLTGTVVFPASGFATMADGSSFFRLGGLGSNIYYNPAAGSFFNPATGVVGKPAMINGLIP
ncbi:MAG TPA: hypothetical protein VG097_18370 [Gemmata sp.]|nr:hypothetical protein [Gemmata sp.]